MIQKLDNLIHSYNASGLSKELNGIANIESAIRCKYTCNEREYCCRHQRRIRKSELDKLCEKLLCEVTLIYSARNFEELYYIVANAKVKHIGSLTIYDISLRIAYVLNSIDLLPNTYVYLNAGAMVGAMVLYKKGLLKDKPSHKMDINAFGVLSKLQQLDPKEYGFPKRWTFAMLIEDFLCSKHSELANL